MGVGGLQVLERHVAAEVVERQEELAAGERRPEEDGEDDGEGAPRRRRHAVVPAAEREGEEETGARYPGAGKKIDGLPAGYRTRPLTGTSTTGLSGWLV